MKYANKILIVDDEPGARDILEALLLREGYQLDFASSGKEALLKAQELPPSLVLLDVMMPEMDGFEVCQKLREMPLLAEVPIIMITALDDRDSRLQGIRAGADDFLSKPFDREELRARVRTIMRLNRYRRLHTERAKFEWVVQHAHEGYVIVTETDRIIYANSHARLFLNIPSAPDAGDQSGQQEPLQLSETFLSLARSQYALEPQDAWASWPEPSAQGRYLVRPETRTSDAFWIQVDLLEIPEETGFEKVVHLYDVTAQMQAQRNRWGFHTMMCHKLRTPLVGILGSLEFLSDHVEKLSADEIKEFSEMSLLSVRRLHGEIEDILQYMKAPGMLEADPFHLSEFPPVIAKIGKELKLDAITITMPAELADYYLVFSRQTLELIFWEILENSIKFHPEHSPEVHITVSLLDSGKIRTQIVDNGLNLSPEQLSQVWTPYYQGEKYLTGEEEGMGLGLAMVALVLWEAGGHCLAYNREGQPGIVIEMDMPLAKCPGSEE